MSLSKKTAYKPGHIVRYTGEFLRNTGMQAGAPRNGKVTEVKELYVYVLWCDRDTVARVHPGNIEFDPGARKHNEAITDSDQSNKLSK